jgi:hypothetical protein
MSRAFFARRAADGLTSYAFLSSGETRGVKSAICPTAKAEYFRSEYWTGFADLPVVLLCRMRRGKI